MHPVTKLLTLDTLVVVVVWRDVRVLLVRAGQEPNSNEVILLMMDVYGQALQVCQQPHRLVLAHTHTHTHLTALFPGIPRWAGTRKVKPIWILLKQETVSGSGISWAICKSAPRSRQTTTPAPYHSVFYRPDGLPAAQPTTSKHCLQCFCSNTLCVLLGGNVTFAGWQVTPCDPIWHLCSRSGEASC